MHRPFHSCLLIPSNYLVSLCIPWNSLWRPGLQTCNNPPASLSEHWDCRVRYHAWLYLAIHLTRKLLRKKSGRQLQSQASHEGKKNLLCHKLNQSDKILYTEDHKSQKKGQLMSMDQRINTVKTRLSLKTVHRPSAVPIKTVNFSQT